jgi:hypothetical protein
MITLDKEWLCDVVVGRIDYGYATYPMQFLIEIKNALVAAGWSVAQSSDKISVAASDLWTNYTKVIWGATTHSWIVLENADFHVGFQFVIDCIGTNDVYCTFATCSTGYNLDGTTSLRPTPIGTELTWVANITAPNTNYVLSNVIKVLRSTDKQCWRIVVSNAGISGNAYATYQGQAWFFEKPKNPASWWPTPIIAARFDHSGNGLTHSRLVTSGSATMATVINGTRVNLLLGTIGVGDWPNRSGVYGFGSAYDGKLSMPPIYWVSDNAAYPGVMGQMYDAYPVSPYHLDGTRYPTTANARGLVKMGALALGCPYGPMVV